MRNNGSPGQHRDKGTKQCQQTHDLHPFWLATDARSVHEAVGHIHGIGYVSTGVARSALRQHRDKGVAETFRMPVADDPRDGPHVGPVQLRDLG